MNKLKIGEYHSKKNALKPNVVQFTENSLFHGYKDIMKALNKSQTPLIPSGGAFGATSIPLTVSMVGNILQNPTALSINSSMEMAYADSVIKSCLKYRQIMITSRIGQYRHKNPEIEHYVRYAIKNLKRGWLNLMDSLMTADWGGFSANYIKWKTYQGKYIFSDIIWMPPTSILMAINDDGSLKEHGGIMQYYYNTNLNGWAEAFTYSNHNYANPNIPRGDFPIPLRVPYMNPMYLQPFNLKDLLLYTPSGTTNANNPYGDMSTRAIWNDYNRKMATWENLMIACTFKAAPMVVFYTDSTRPVQLSNGTTINIADDMVRNINEYNGNGMMVIMGKKGETVEHAVIDNTADLSKFTEVLNGIDNQIRYGLMASDSSMQSSGSFASASVHSSMQAKDIEYRTETVMDALLNQPIKQMINYNWKGEEDLGHFEIVEQSLDDKLKMAKLFEFGEKYNILCRDPSNKEQSLLDMNMMRETMEWGTVKDLWENPPVEEDPINVGDMNRAAGKPHADGVGNYAKRYSKS